MPVLEAADGMEVRRDHFYVIPPNASLEIADGRLRTAPRIQSHHPHLPVDRFLRSLAQDADERAVAVILSGSGSTVRWPRRGKSKQRDHRAGEGSAGIPACPTAPKRSRRHHENRAAGPRIGLTLARIWLNAGGSITEHSEGGAKQRFLCVAAHRRCSRRAACMRSRIGHREIQPRASDYEDVSTRRRRWPRCDAWDTKSTGA